MPVLYFLKLFSDFISKYIYSDFSFSYDCFHYATDDVDTRAITRRLRQDGSLIGVLSTEETKADEELLEMSRSWDIVGKVQNLNCVSDIENQKSTIFPNYHCRY